LDSKWAVQRGNSIEIRLGIEMSFEMVLERFLWFKCLFLELDTEEAHWEIGINQLGSAAY
jgi:hypothetical protein